MHALYVLSYLHIKIAILNTGGINNQCTKQSLDYDWVKTHVHLVTYKCSLGTLCHKQNFGSTSDYSLPSSYVD